MKFAGIRLLMLISASDRAQKGHCGVTQSTRAVLELSVVALSVVVLLTERIVKRTPIPVAEGKVGY